MCSNPTAAMQPMLPTQRYVHHPNLYSTQLPDAASWQYSSLLTWARALVSAPLNQGLLLHINLPVPSRGTCPSIPHSITPAKELHAGAKKVAGKVPKTVAETVAETAAWSAWYPTVLLTPLVEVGLPNQQCNISLFSTEAWNAPYCQLQAPCWHPGARAGRSSLGAA
jgi:hypothetical protein